MESALEWRLWAVVPIVEVNEALSTFWQRTPFGWALRSSNWFPRIQLVRPHSTSVRLVSWPPLCTVQRRKLRFRGFKCQLSITAKCGTEIQCHSPYGAYRLMHKASNKHVSEKHVILGRDQCCEKNNAWREMMGGWGPFLSFEVK